MSMIRWTNDITLKGRKRDENIRDELEVAPIEDELGENSLRWFSHVHRRHRCNS